MKKYLALFLLFSVSELLAQTPSPLKDYRSFLAGLDSYSPERIELAERNLKTNHLTADLSLRDRLFSEFLEFFTAYIDALQAHLLQELLLTACGEAHDVPADCERRLASLRKSHGLSLMLIDKAGRKFDEKIENTLSKNSISIGFCEEVSPAVKEKGSYILLTFGDFVSPVMKEFLELRDLEINKSIAPGCEGFPDHQPSAAEYRRRKNALDLFTAVHKDFELIAHVKRFQSVYQDNYSEYRSTIAP